MKQLLQVRIPSDIMEILDRKIVASGKTRAGWLRDLLEKECDRIAPKYEIVNLDSMEVVKTGGATVLQHNTQPWRPRQIAIEDDKRSNQDWNMEPDKHEIRIKATLYKILYTMFDQSTSRLIVDLEE